MAVNGNILELERCLHCGVDKPSLPRAGKFETLTHKNTNPREWYVYQCTRCGGMILTGSPKGNRNVYEIYPSDVAIEIEIPDRPREYLQQAISSINAPAGAVMLAASAVDSMLKAIGLKEGSLYSRIQNAASKHLITEQMARWAHDVRLDANDQRHADDTAALPTELDAMRVIEFTRALATFLFVLPARVQRGIENANQTDNARKTTPTLSDQSSLSNLGGV